MIAGLVLAAGAGTRFGGSSKLLVDLGGRPLLEYAVRAQCAVSAIDRVVVVLGAFAEAVRGAVDFGCAETVVCAAWQDGQAASLRCGLRAVADADRVLVTVGDQPLLTAEVIARFVSAPAGTRATYEGRPGHPVVLGESLIAAAMGLTGDEGARRLLGGGPTIECAALCSGRDVDTPEDLEAIRALIGRGTYS